MQTQTQYIYINCILFSLKAKYIYTFLPTTFSSTLHCRHSSSLGKTSALIGFVNQGFKRPLALLYFRYGNTTLPSIYYIYIFVLPINPMMMVHYWNRSVFWCGVLFVCSFGIFFLDIFFFCKKLVFLYVTYGKYLEGISFRGSKRKESQIVLFNYKHH